MKDIDELSLPDNVKYTEEHEWVLLTGETIRIGVSDFAQDQLGDIVFVELPEVGDSFDKGDEFGTLESVKAVSELYTPTSGVVVAVNKDLEDNPELINQDPYATWIVEIKPSAGDEYDKLLSAGDYLTTLRQG